MHSQALADLLDGLAATLKETAAAARHLTGNELFDDLPMVLSTRHMARLEGQTVSTIWRRAHQGPSGGLPPTIEPPAAGKPLRWYKEAYLAHRRRIAQQGEG